MENFNFAKYKHNVYSQNGEDGIIQELLLRLKDKVNPDPWCVEFGAWDGIHCSNTFNLVKSGWNAFYIEGNKERFKNLEKNCSEFKKLICECKYVEKDFTSINSLDNILKGKGIPKDFDILSIDIDSFDLEVWESLTNFCPKIVIIEINGRYLPGTIKWHTGRPGNKFGGNSFSATLMVAEDKGYQLICQSGNMIFIKKEYLKYINLNTKYINYPELLFDYDAFLESKKLNLLNEIKTFFKQIIRNLFLR